MSSNIRATAHVQLLTCGLSLEAAVPVAASIASRCGMMPVGGGPAMGTSMWPFSEPRAEGEGVLSGVAAMAWGQMSMASLSRAGSISGRGLLV